jgi:hypothetical protein
VFLVPWRPYHVPETRSLVILPFASTPISSHTLCAPHASSPPSQPHFSQPAAESAPAHADASAIHTAQRSPKNTRLRIVPGRVTSLHRLVHIPRNGPCTIFQCRSRLDPQRLQGASLLRMPQRMHMGTWNSAEATVAVGASGTPKHLGGRHVRSLPGLEWRHCNHRSQRDAEKCWRAQPHAACCLWRIARQQAVSGACWVGGGGGLGSRPWPASARSLGTCPMILRLSCAQVLDRCAPDPPGSQTRPCAEVPCCRRHGSRVRLFCSLDSPSSPRAMHGPLLEGPGCGQCGL